ncbi:MAG: CapA family protein [Patescibacteria group bacterium]|nr:CapA family protein [Patescibacteria group bacterium]
MRLRLQFQIFLWVGLGLLLYALWLTLRVPAVQHLVERLVADQPVTVLAGGDVNLGRQTGQEILAGNIDYPFQNITGILQSADITFVNLESQLADLNGETQSPTNEYRFAGPPQGALALHNAGIDIVSIANNHMWDYGQERLQETINNLNAQEIVYVGADMLPENRFAAKILEVRGQKIAFLAFTDLLNGYEKSGADQYVAFGDEDACIAEIKQVREFADWVLVSLHAGAEYTAKPTARTIELAHTFIDAGADAILGHHPHVPHPIEIYKDKPIFYSLGNFAFWQPFTFWTQNSFLIKLELTEPRQLDYEIIPVKAGWQPEMLTKSDDIATLMTRLHSQI